MPIAKHRDNLSDLVDKAAKRRDRVNTRKRRLSSVHVSVPVHSEVQKLREQRKQRSRQLLAGPSIQSLESGDTEDNLGCAGPVSGDSLPSSPSRIEEGDEIEEEEETYYTELYIRTLARLSFLSTFVYIIVEHHYWKSIRMVFTGLAIYTLACEVSLLEGSHWREFFYFSNGAVNLFFLIDGLMKLWSFFGFRKIEEMFSSRNSLYGSFRRCGIIDITIASLCFYFATSFAGDWLKLVRVMFIALFGVQQLTSLDVLMSGIGFGLHSVFYTWLLLVLVFIVYGAAGVTFYAENDPYHFGTIAISMWTFFQISTMDDWIEVMLLNSYGCDVYPVDYFPGTERVDIDQYGHFYLPVCTSPRQQKVVSIIIFFSFIVIVGFVLMSLTIAAVTAGINDRLDNLQKEELREELSGLNKEMLSRDDMESRKIINTTSAMSKSISNMLRQGSGLNLDNSLSADPALLKLMLFQALNVKKKNDFNAVGSAKKVSRRMAKKDSQRVMGVKPSPDVIARANSSEPTLPSNSFSPAPTAAIPTLEAGELDSLASNKIIQLGDVKENASSRYTLSSASSNIWVFDKRRILARLKSFRNEQLNIRQMSLNCRNLASHKSYNILMNLFIVFGAVFELNSLQEDVYKSNFDMPVNISLQVVFTIDIFIKLLAVYPTWANFWKKKWNRFDVCTVFLLWVALAFNFQGLLGRLLKLLRVLRIFRILKLISKIPELHVIMMSIASSIRALAYIVALLFIFFFHFAVAGIYLFEANDPFHFQGLVRSFTTLFQVATLDNWGQVARINMLGCNNTDYDLEPPCTDPQGLGWIAAWYFIIFIILGVMVLLSLFVGVIITSMELLKEGLKEEREVLEKVRNLQYKYDITDVSVEHLLEIFDMIDIGSNGKLTLDELKPVLEIVSVTPVQQFEMFVQVDTDRSGQIDFSEFCELIQLIGKVYIDAEQKKGVNIIRRTRTLNKSSHYNVLGLKSKVKSKLDVKHADSYSDAGSEIASGKRALMRGGSSDSLVQGGGRDSIVEVNEYNDNDIDIPVAEQDLHINRGKNKPSKGTLSEKERPRTNGGIWSKLNGSKAVNDPSPRSHFFVNDTAGHISGLSPVPSAYELLSLSTEHRHTGQEDHGKREHYAEPYVPVNQYSHHFIPTPRDDDEEHHFHLRGHTASNKLNILQGRPSSANRPRSATQQVKSQQDAQDALHGLTGSAVHLYPFNEDESIKFSANATVHKAVEAAHALPKTSKSGDTSKAKRDDLSLADMSQHSLKNIDDFSLFGDPGKLRSKPTNDQGPGKKMKSPPIQKGELALDSIDSRNQSMASVMAEGHFVKFSDVVTPQRIRDSNRSVSSVCSDDVWEVGANDDPTAGLSEKQ